MKPNPNLTTVLGSKFRFAIAIQMIPTKAAKMMTNKELAALFTPLGSRVIMPKNLSFKLLAANKLKDPPACSKMAQKITENNIILGTEIKILI